MHMCKPSHAMLLVGVDVDVDGKVFGWKVQNSWGKKTALLSMEDKWFTENVFEIVVPRNVYLGLGFEYREDPEHFVLLNAWDPISSVANGEHLNVYGKALQQCSEASMAMTGFSRDGKCASHEGDAGSHHVCINDIDKKENGQNFCQITGQTNWCDSKGPCTENKNTVCPHKNWCVCEWAFDSFVKKQSCDSFKINCDATNKLVLDHYNTDPTKYGTALACIQEQCGSTRSIVHNLLQFKT